MQNCCEEFLEIENFDGGRNRYISVENPFYEEVLVIVEQIFKDLRADEYEMERKKLLNRYGSVLKNKMTEILPDYTFIQASFPCYQLEFTV